jgi:hypothetical protein
MGRRSYPGGIISGAEPTVNGVSASGMWTTQTAAQKRTSNTWPVPGVIAVAQASGITIANVAVTDSNYVVKDDTPFLSTAGGFIRVTGAGFASGAVVYVGGSAAVTTSFISSTELRAQVGAGSSNTVPVYVVNADNSTGIKLNALTYSGTPTWTTGSTLDSQVLESAFSISLSATSDSAVTYAVTSGSSLPSGTTLFSNGVFAGTVIGLSVDTAYSFSVDAIDAQLQETPRTFTVTIQLGEPFFYLNALALTGDIPAGNTWIKDSSINNYTMIVAGDAKPAYFSPYNTSWGVFFDGSSYLYPASATNLAFGTSDWAIECWTFATSAGSSSAIIYDARPAGTLSGAYPLLYIVTSTLRVTYNVGFTVAITSDTAAALGTWNHIVVSRVSGTTRMFLNGVLQSQTYADSNTYVNGANRPAIGTDGNSPSSYFFGHISNLRVLRGTGYTSVTIPTSISTAIANTQLLTCQDNRFRDNSTNAYTMTVGGGTPRVVGISPFTETDTTTSSAYFDGTGDAVYHSTGLISDFGTGDFTVEYWVYTSTTSSGYTQHVGAATTSTGIAFGTGASNGMYATTQAVAFSGNINVPLNQWCHIAYSRQSGIMRGYVNGVIGYSASVTTNFNEIGTNIGAATGGSAYAYTGYISDVRVIKGTALYTTASFTPPATQFANVAGTSLLTLQYRGAENNQRFYDKSNNRVLVNRFNNAAQGSFSPFSPSGWSNHFDGSTGYINASLVGGNLSGTWTIEFWVNFSALGAQNTMTNLHSGSAAGMNIWKNTSNQLVVDDGQTAQTAWSTVTFTAAGVWYHVAVTRDGTTTRGYINGVLAGSHTFTPASINAVTIGRFNNNPFYYLQGYISNFRVVDGTVIYTAAFTPPTTELVLASGIKLLTCNSNRIIDTTGQGITLTSVGGARVTNFSPFRPSPAYSPTTHIGSVYGDGSSHVAVPVGAMGLSGYTTSSDFTLECWAYPAAAPTTNWIPILCTDNGTGAGGTEIRISQNHNAAGFGYLIPNNANSADVFVGFGTLPLHQWHHLALVRFNNVVTLYRNGANVGFTAGATFAINNATAGVVNVMRNQYPATDGYFNGYVSDVRIIKNQAMYTGNFTVPTGPLTVTSNTVVSLNFVDAVAVDASVHSDVHMQGNVTLSNVQSKFGTGSFNFRGSNNSMVVSYNPNIDFFGTSPFTLELWMYVTSLKGYQGILGKASADSNGWALIFETNNTLSFYAGNGTWSVVMTGVTTPTINTWHHIAVTRDSSNVWRLFYDGTISNSTTNTLSMASYVQPLYIGKYPYFPSYNAGQDFGGYIDDIRITKGVARYTAAYTVPTRGFFLR